MKKGTLSVLAVSLAALFWATGCECFPSARGPVLGAEDAGCEPCGKPGLRTVEQYLPGGDRDCAAVRVEKAAPECVNVGQTFDYRIRVTNLSDGELTDFTVWDTHLANFTIVESDPEVSDIRNGWVTWRLGSLPAGQSKLIKLRARASSTGTMKACTEVTYRMPEVCLNINVERPALALTKTMPDQALQCDTIPVKLTVSNPGTSAACNVVIRDPLPEGLSTMDGKNVLSYDVGTLEPGQSREFTAQLRADDTGAYVNKAYATADGDLRADALAVTTNVVKPELAVTKTAPRMRYVGRPIEYTIGVINGPEIAAENVRLMDDIPANAKFVSASDGGQLQNGQVVWNFGTLQPRQSRNVTLTLQADCPGTLTNIARVTASCGEAQGQASVDIQGIPAILLEVVDLDDPIEVGNRTVYEITVLNQGSKMDTNVLITAQLPEQLRFVSASGPTEAAAEGRTIRFRPLATLAPGAKAQWRVTAEAVGTGDVRFETTLETDMLTSPARETEPTRLYD